MSSPAVTCADSPMYPWTVVSRTASAMERPTATAPAPNPFAVASASPSATALTSTSPVALTSALLAALLRIYAETVGSAVASASAPFPAPTPALEALAVASARLFPSAWISRSPPAVAVPPREAVVVPDASASPYTMAAATPA